MDRIAEIIIVKMLAGAMKQMLGGHDSPILYGENARKGRFFKTILCFAKNKLNNDAIMR